MDTSRTSINSECYIQYESESSIQDDPYYAYDRKSPLSNNRYLLDKSLTGTKRDFYSEEKLNNAKKEQQSEEQIRENNRRIKWQSAQVSLAILKYLVVALLADGRFSI
jgi:hypothetical protein